MVSPYYIFVIKVLQDLFFQIEELGLEGRSFVHWPTILMRYFATKEPRN